MRRYITATITSFLCLTSALAQKCVVWERPLAAYSIVSGRLDVNRVVFADTATILTFHVNMPYTPQIGFTSETMLQADGKDYKVKSIKNYALNAGINVPSTGVMDVDMVFVPVPLDVKSLTFTMPQAFSISGIRDRYAKREGIADTYWRDEKTGDWLLGVGKSHVVYDSKMWSIISQTEKKGTFTISASNGSDNIIINTGKEKKGLRTFRVGKEKFVCSMITGDYLPDYPTKDTTTRLANNGYRMGDSVTIVGWFKDMPREMWQKGNDFNAAYESIFIDKNKNYYTKLDSLGRFTLRIPVENTQMLYCDWGRTSIMFLAEPGETYFLMKDFAENKTLVMGRNARLQNELLAHDFFYRSGNYQEVSRLGSIMTYMTHCDSLNNEALAKLDTECKKYPTLSSRYETLKRQEIITDVGCSLMQGRFSVRGFMLPKEYVDYVTGNYWNKIEEPYTALGNHYTTFFRDYCDHKSGCLTEGELGKYEKIIATADSLGLSQTQRDVLLSTTLYQEIEHDRKPLEPFALKFANDNISLEAGKQVVYELNGKYEAIAKQTLSTDNLKSSDDVKGLSEGEQILQKILEPYKGKIVLLDIWGTWCGPCKEMLSHSQEEYEHLKNYPMVYLYLANSSPEDSWKNVIKEYNVTGDNVVHYNLPSAQQNAIETYLNIHSFPTYKLFDQQGKLLDVNADPHDLNGLEGLIKRLVEK